MKIVYLIVILPFYCYSQTSFSNRQLKDGKSKADTSYVYALPFEENKKIFLVQGYETFLSHKGIKALDFKVRNGTKICAAREGVVIAMRDDSEKRGLKSTNLSDGNFITIEHADGTIANYWHLKKNGVLVNLGDSLERGQLIGLSGNTGYSAFPHLHFEVMGYDESGVHKQIATRFNTSKGTFYLRPGKFYRAIH